MHQVEDDPLREPTTARARLRRARQQEAAKRYETTYHLRTDGHISSVRTHPTTTLKTESFPSATPAAVRPATAVNDKPAAAVLPSRPAAGVPVAVATSATKTTGSAAAVPVMQGRLVNVSGQTLDGKCEAVKRILQGEFYTVRGGSVGELASKPEGKHMRFRAASQPPLFDGCAGGKDAFTMTRQAKTKTLAYERRAAAESPAHDGHRASSNSPNRSKDKHQHHSASKRHHCHHGHRDAYWEDEHDYDGRYGVYASQQLEQPPERRSTKHHHHGGKDGMAVSSQQRRDKGDDDDDNVRYMEALDLDRLFAERRGAKVAGTRPGVNRRPGTSQGYRLPTAASANKAASQEEFQLTTRRLNTSDEPPHPAAAAVTVHAKVPVHRDAYETALKQQHAHPPGHAAVVSQDEMNKILSLVEKAPSHFEGAPASAGGGRQGGTRVGSRRRPDSAGILS